MAAIRETLILEDKFTSTMTQCLQVAQRMANMLDDVRASTMNVETAAAATAVQMQELAGKMTQTNSRGTSLLGTIRNLAGTFLGMQSVRWLVNTSDQLTSINARLRLMTGSAEAAAAAQEEIYQAAMRSRGADADMADFVSQLGTVAGNAFTGTDELVAFAEQIQKQMAISGASGASAQAALVQLTQGLASGTLRGEELNSVLEQTPMIAQTIAERTGSIGLITGESIGQVASQTLQSLAATNEVCTMPVFRPVIGFDKQEIVDVSEKIGTYETSIQPYEDCCTIFVAKHPVTKPNINVIHSSERRLEEKIDQLVETALETTEQILCQG